MAKTAGIFLLGALSFFASFFVTLWLTDSPTANAPPIKTDIGSVSERLAARYILNNTDLVTAARNIGLYSSEKMSGNVDVMTRISERDVRIDGWAADPDGNATPANILVFVGGSLVATAQTKGERPDITKALHLFFGSEENVIYSASFSCQPGDQPVIVAIGTKGYASLKSSRPCP